MDSYNLKVLTPMGEYFSGEVTSSKIPTLNGEIEVLGKHCTYVGIIGNGVLTAKKTDGTTKQINISGGTCHFEDKDFMVLADSAVG